MEQKQVKHIDLGEINVSICIGASATIEAVIAQNRGGTTVNKQYVSDFIGEDVISTWEPGQILMIISGTDTGKSHFIRNKVYEHFKMQGKQVLYLVSRTNLKELSAPVIKCKKTPRKKCSFVAEVKEKR